jgi:soluble lytic murein transglycosylase-like protein
MPRHGRPSDWLGAIEDKSFLDASALPRHSRVVKFAAIKTAADAREYARRLFAGTVNAAKGKTGAALDRWALAAKQYVLAHDLAGQGGSLVDVKAGLHAANLNTDAAVKTPPGPRVPWTPPSQDAPPEAPSAPTTPPSSAPPSAPAPVPEAPGAAPSVTVPQTVPAEWLDASLMPEHSRVVKFSAIKNLADVVQYALRFFAGNVEHGNRKSATPAIRQRFAEAARIYVYTRRLAKMPGFPATQAGIDSLKHDLAAADILTAQALAAERGTPMPALEIQWATTPALAEQGIATFKILGDLSAPSAEATPPPATPPPATPGAESASLPAPIAKGLPQTFDADINRFRGQVPIAFVRALIQAESGFDPRNENPTSKARGLLQITPIVDEDWNKAHPAELVTRDDLFDPATNLKLGLDLLGRIVAKYAKQHTRTMTPNFASPRYVEVLAEAWNVGHGVIGGIIGMLEAAGVDVTVENIVKRGPTLPGVSPKLAARIEKRGTKFPVRVRKLYFAELEASPETPTRPTVASSRVGDGIALALVAGLLLFGDELLDDKRRR